MDVPMSWLKEYADVPTSVKDFMEDITLTGSKVEGVTTLCGNVRKIVTSQIKKIEQHPDADKLVVCTINAGQGSDLTIVTAAKNVTEGGVCACCIGWSSFGRWHRNSYR